MIYLRNKRKLKTSVPFLDKGDGTRTQCASGSAEVLADAFSSVFIDEPLGPLPKFPEVNDDSSIFDEIYIHADDVKRELTSFKLTTLLYYISNLRAGRWSSRTPPKGSN